MHFAIGLVSLPRGFNSRFFIPRPFSYSKAELHFAILQHPDRKSTARFKTSQNTDQTFTSEITEMFDNCKLHSSMSVSPVHRSFFITPKWKDLKPDAHSSLFLFEFYQCKRASASLLLLEREERFLNKYFMGGNLCHRKQ